MASSSGRYARGSRVGAGGRPTKAAAAAKVEQEAAARARFESMFTRAPAPAPAAAAAPAAAPAAPAVAAGPQDATLPLRRASPQHASLAPAPAPGDSTDSDEDEPLATRLSARAAAAPTAPPPAELPRPAQPHPPYPPSSRQLEHAAKHAATRELLSYIVARKLNGVTTAAALADAIGLNGQALSRYKTGRGDKGSNLAPEELNERRSSILRRLSRAKLPTEIPATNTDTGNTPAAEERATRSRTAAPPAEAAAAPPRRAAPPPPRPPPRKPILEVSLKEVEGYCQGGQVQIMALGETVSDDPRWRIDCPGHPDGQLQIRAGLCGRRTLGSRGAAGGRTFEWWVGRIDAPHELAHDGRPLWCAKEVTRHEVGSLIIGRARGGPLNTFTGPSTPGMLWSAIAERCGISARLVGIVHCGFISPGVQELLGAVNATDAPPPPFGSRKGIEGCNPRGSWRRELGKLAGEEFVEAMERVCPGMRTN